MQLKLSAMAWMIARGMTDAEMERGYGAGIADVISNARRLAVECGETEPRKLLGAVDAEYACLWLPYRHWGDYQPGETAEALLCLSPRRRRGRPVPDYTPFEYGLGDGLPGSEPNAFKDHSGSGFL